MAHITAMSDLAAIRHERDLRRLNCAIYQAELHATGEQGLTLVQLKHAVRLGHVGLGDAIGAVNQLRACQQHAA